MENAKDIRFLSQDPEALNVDIPDSVLLKYALMDLRKARVEIGKLETYITELEERIGELEKYKKNAGAYVPMEEYTSSIQRKKETIHALEAKNQKLKEEIYKLRFRLNQVYGLLLQNGTKEMSIDITEKQS